MRIYIDEHKKRLPQPLDKALKIREYGPYNLYPQLINELIRKSPIASSATDIRADFLNGEGFEEYGDLIVNNDGHTLDDILNFISHDAATFTRSFALFFNLNGLGNIEEVQYLPFEFVRQGAVTSTGRYNTVVISRNWEMSSQKLPQGQELRIQRFPIFNPKKAQAEALTAGRGMVLYYTGKPYTYPYAYIDPVIDPVESEISIREWQKENAKYGFNGATLFKHFGNLEEGSEEEYLFQQKLQKLTRPGVVGVEIDEELKDSSLFETIPGDNKDRLFEFTTGDIKETILTRYGLTPELFGALKGGAVINSQSMKDHYNYYNHRTKNDRIEIARQFRYFMKFWHEGPLDPGEIKKQEYETPVFKQEVVDNSSGLTDMEREEETDE